MEKKAIMVGFLGILISFSISSQVRAEINLDHVHLPPGFKIEVYAEVPGARSMTLGKDGVIFVGTNEQGRVYAVTTDGKSHLLAEKLNSPNGVAYRNGELYVAEISRILKYSDVDAKIAAGGEIERNLTPTIVYDKFPKDKHHGWKFIAFGPDGKLYVPVGGNCNVCDVKDPYATITRMDADGKNYEIFARGVRNTVGFDWSPLNHEIWFTDNGRDMMGDDMPPDELNHATKLGQHFGFPFCHGGDIVDPQFAEDHRCSEFVKPEIRLGAHVASLGMRFYTGKMFPNNYLNQIFIAEHGSWNRSKKSGYRLTLVRIKADGHPLSYEPFATGWMKDEKNWGRPVDVLVAPDGALFVSDDFAGAIYRISYKKN